LALFAALAGVTHKGSDARRGIQKVVASTSTSVNLDSETY